MSKNNEVNLNGLDSASAPVATPALPTQALTPEMQATMNSMISEAVKSVFASMGPLLSSIALTPEKMAEAEKLRRAPDPAAVARELRERKLSQQEFEDNERRKQEIQAQCGHRYVTGASAINPIRNYADRQARGVCVLCAAFLTPREWRIGAPNAENPRGVPYIAEAHPQYRMVLDALAAKG